MANNSTNKEVIAIVAKGLNYLLPQMVFIGGAVTELYVPSTNDIAEVRPTDDVDCVVQLASYHEFIAIETELRKLGFENEKSLINRWLYKGIKVDIMPDDVKILGFSNPWYKKGIEHTIQFEIAEDTTIRLFSFPYFLATKITAMNDRGIHDLRLSKDFEDIVFCLFYRQAIVVEIQHIDNSLKLFIQQNMQMLMKHSGINEAIYSVLPTGEVFEENIEKVKAIMQTICEVV